MFKKKLLTVVCAAVCAAAVLCGVIYSTAPITRENPARTSAKSLSAEVSASGKDMPANAAARLSHEDFLYLASEPEYLFRAGEDIPLHYMLETDKKAEGIEYEADGFNMKPQPMSRIIPHNIQLTVRHDGVTENAVFGVSVRLSDGKVLTAKLYGVLTEYGVCISPGSFKEAYGAYHYHRLSLGIITQHEYDWAVFGDSENPYVTNAYTSLKEIPQELLPEASAVIAEAEANSTRALSPYAARFFLQLSWQDDVPGFGYTHPLRFAKVELLLNGNTVDTVYVDTVYMDWGGGWYVLAYDPGVNFTSADITVNVYAGGQYTNVKSVLLTPYVYPRVFSVTPGSLQVATYCFQMNGTVDINGVEYSIDTNLAQAFQISQAAGIAAWYVVSAYGSGLTFCSVQYPSSANPTGRYLANNIFIPPADSGHIIKSYANWDLIMHEYGHHTAAKLGLDDFTGIGVYTSNFDVNFNIKGKSEGIRIAWAEGYANAFMIMSQRHMASYFSNVAGAGDYAYTWGTPDASGNLVSLNLLDAPPAMLGGDAVITGESNIASVACAILNIREILGDESLFYVLTHWLKPTYFAFFLNRCLYYYPEHNLAFREILTKSRIAPSLNPNPNLNVSPPTFSWVKGDQGSLNADYCLFVYDAAGAEIFNTYDRAYGKTTGTSLTLTPSEWSSVPVGKFYVSVAAHQATSPATGTYFSARIEFTKSTVTPTRACVCEPCGPCEPC